MTNVGEILRKGDNDIKILNARTEKIKMPYERQRKKANKLMRKRNENIIKRYCKRLKRITKITWCKIYLNYIK